MYQPREFGHGTLTQRVPRDDHCNDQVTINFDHLDDDPQAYDSTVKKGGQVADSKPDTMRIQLFRSSSRLSLILLFVLFFFCYLYLFKSYEPVLDDLNIDLKAIERDLESDDRIKVMTYQPLTHFPAEGQRNKQKGRKGRLKGKHLMKGHKEEETKYHNIWAWANASINIHEFFPDTPDVDLVLEALATAPIIHVDTMGPGDYEAGTSQKWLVTLEGGQKALVKLGWEKKKLMKDNAHCNFGYEMPWSEVAAFHLHRVLGFRNTPYVVGRKIKLAEEIVPVASDAVKAQVSTKGGLTCVTGKCHFCKEPTTLCPQDGIVTASVAYWVPRHLKTFTYPPRYMPYSTTNQEEWGKIPFNNKTYCDKIRKEYPYDIDRYYHDLFDFAVVDAISFHFDSKHYILYDNSSATGLTVRLDHGRAFCANDRDDEHVFLAPISQCCTLRYETLWALQALTKGTLRRDLSQALAKDTTWGDLLDESHMVAMERRLNKVLEVVKKCSAANGANNVFVG